jgi:hypothetical protein
VKSVIQREPFATTSVDALITFGRVLKTQKTLSLDLNKNIMKAKMLVIAAFCCIAGAAKSSTPGMNPTLDIVRKDTSSVYTVNYQGSKTGKVTVIVKDQTQNTVLIKWYKNVKDFSLPVNFSSVPEGAYTIQIDNGVEKISETITYTKDTAPTYSRVESLDNGLYLLTCSHKGTEKITVRVYNEWNVQVFEEDKFVKGDFSMLFKVKDAIGQPYFEVSGQSGTFILVPGHPQVVLVNE